MDKYPRHAHEAPISDRSLSKLDSLRGTFVNFFSVFDCLRKGE